MQKRAFEATFTRFLTSGEPFFFLINFTKDRFYCNTFENALNDGFHFNINGTTNFAEKFAHPPSFVPELTVQPYAFEEYLKRFEEVMGNIKIGNSFLVNLTFPSKITSPVDLESVFQRSKATYKLWHRNHFVCFSPESFIKIRNGHIYTYPMKGTIDAMIENAENLLLNDPKEEQEHNTIVDLLRNDLSMVAREVTVTRFRFIESIKSQKGEILQTVSEIRGKLKTDWKKTFAHDLLKMLPAGSVSGAPKPKTVEIIKRAENYDRGFYTGVFGVFDGVDINSAVAIRFIEKINNEFWYKSGGGITHKSNVKEEYIELLKKIYIPTL